ncbi:MAG: helix-turn-helix transcriptional regulator [Muribaculaceae bacterium]|nr:helix-turn-helix transcriptional regulator [Muribaculaceae bacterium]
MAETLKEERLKAGLTQQQLAERIGPKKTYISHLENGKADVRIYPLFRIFEGLGRRISLTIL